MRIGIRPTVDLVFKNIFGSPEHSHLTLSFLNSLLPLVDAPLASSIDIVNPFKLAEFSGDKEIAVDIHARDETGRDFQVEMQVRSNPSLPDRMHDNWARIFMSQLRRGQEYQRHKPVVSVWILGATCFADSSWLHAFRTCDLQRGTKLGESLLIVTIELGKRAALPDLSEEVIFRPGIDEWLYLLAHGEDIDPEGPRYGEVEKDIREAVEIMETYSKAQKARYTYDRRLEWERLRAEEIREIQESREARENGRAEGLAEGRVEVARRLKERGMDLETIASITQLELEVVKRL